MPPACLWMFFHRLPGPSPALRSGIAKFRATVLRSPPVGLGGVYL